MKVSIGLPFYNDEKTLRYTIQSILLQSYTDWELILLDDGSTDGSLAIAKSIKDKRVRVVSDNENKGLAVRLNEIANLANGQYLARMDADDLMHPDRIKEQVLFLEENPEIDVVGTNA
ncbi:MAG: glycosyltransferase family 2 protein, partial [Selenomonadaceae bacterium]